MNNLYNLYNFCKYAVFEHSKESFESQLYYFIQKEEKLLNDNSDIKEELNFFHNTFITLQNIIFNNNEIGKMTLRSFMNNFNDMITYMESNELFKSEIKDIFVNKIFQDAISRNHLNILINLEKYIDFDAVQEPGISKRRTMAPWHLLSATFNSTLPVLDFLLARTKLSNEHNILTAIPANSYIHPFTSSLSYSFRTYKENNAYSDISDLWWSIFYEKPDIIQYYDDNLQTINWEKTQEHKTLNEQRKFIEKSGILNDPLLELFIGDFVKDEFQKNLNIQKKFSAAIETIPEDRIIHHDAILSRDIFLYQLFCDESYCYSKKDVFDVLEKNNIILNEQEMESILVYAISMRREIANFKDWNFLAGSGEALRMYLKKDRNILNDNNELAKQIIFSHSIEDIHKKIPKVTALWANNIINNMDMEYFYTNPFKYDKSFIHSFLNHIEQLNNHFQENEDIQSIADDLKYKLKNIYERSIKKEDIKQGDIINSEKEYLSCCLDIDNWINKLTLSDNKPKRRI